MTTQAETTNNLIELFTDRLTGVGGQAASVANSASAAVTISAIAGEDSVRTIWISDEVARRSPDLIAQLGKLGLRTKQPSSPAEVRDQPFGLAIAEGVIAETGTAIMSEPHLNSRSVTMIVEALVIVCATSTLMPSLDEAASVLRGISAGGASYATFITGPSRTADIERQLTVGVQGPGALHVILIDDLT